MAVHDFPYKKTENTKIWTSNFVAKVLIVLGCFLLAMSASVAFGATATSTATSDDGYGVVGQLGGAYLDSLDLGSASSYTNSGNWLEIQTHLNSGYWQPARSIIPFDVSGIPVGATVTSAKLRVRMGADRYNTNSTGLAITAVGVDFYDNVNDYTKTKFSTVFGSANFADLTQNAWNEIVLSSDFYSYFVGGGTVSLGVRTLLDTSRSEPTGLNSMQIGTYEVGYPAELVIEYTVESGGASTSTATTTDPTFHDKLLVTQLSLMIGVGILSVLIFKKK
jgi:hypothetical protein